MKHLLFLQIIFISFWGCSQEKPTASNEINSNNFVEKVLAEVKHYPEEPMYLLRIAKRGALEIYLNDMPVFKDYDISREYTTGFSINQMILKSGEQKIVYKISSTKDKLPIVISVKVLDNKGNDSPENEETIVQHKKTITMPESGIYEGEFTFNAEVPYENIGWSNGQDLTKFNPKELEKAVVAFYQNMWNIYNDKSKKEDLFPLIFERDKETVISEYKKKEEFDEIFKEILQPYTDSSYKMLPLDNYKMVFYGDGKVAALEQKSTASLLKGESAFYAEYVDDEGNEIYFFTRINLYLPQGKKLEDGLEIIR